MEQIPPPTGFIAVPTNVTINPLGCCVLVGFFRGLNHLEWEIVEHLSPMSTDNGLTWTSAGWWGTLGRGDLCFG